MNHVVELEDEGKAKGDEFTVVFVPEENIKGSV